MFNIEAGDDGPNSPKSTESSSNIALLSNFGDDDLNKDELSVLLS